MDDQLDNDLKNRIREVFDNFEDPAADEGWLLLREKFPPGRAKRRGLVWMYWAAAALLLLFLGFGLWKFTTNNKSGEFSGNIRPAHHTGGVQPAKPAQNENITATQNLAQKNRVAADNGGKNPGKTAASNFASVKTGVAGTVKKQNDGRSLAQNNRALPVSTSNLNSLKTQAATTQPVAKNNSIAPPIGVKPSQALTDSATKKIYIAKTTDTARPAANRPLPDRLAATTPPVNPPQNQGMKPSQSPAKNIASMFAGDQGIKKQQNDGSSKRVRFGIYAATYFNYAKGSGNPVNVGAGFTSDVTISRNLKLVTGVTIAQNSLNFDSGVPTAAAQSSFNSAGATNSTRSYSAFYAAAVTVASEPAFKGYNASLIGLDVPVNLKYEFNPGKSETYVLAGLSSGTFINETYTYQYNYPAFVSPSLQQVQNEVTRRSFNGFYVAKTLNLAFGVGYPVGKNRLILEPFLKYPLDGLGSQNIRFGAGGINLKLNFQSAKK